MSSGNAAQTARIPVRLCLACRCEKPRTELFRLVRPKEVQHLTPNPTGQLPGKGVYFCKSLTCVERLQKDKKLKRLFLDKLQQGALAWMLESLREPLQTAAEDIQT